MTAQQTTKFVMLFYIIVFLMLKMYDFLIWGKKLHYIHEQNPLRALILFDVLKLHYINLHNASTVTYCSENGDISSRPSVG